MGTPTYPPTTAAPDLYPSLSRRPRGAALVAASFLAFSGILYRLSGASPATATLFRCLFAVPVLWLLARREDRILGRRAPRDRGLAVASGVFFALDLLTWSVAVDLVGAGLATVIANMQVVIVPLVGWALLGERPAGRVFAGIALVVVGMVLISGVLETDAYGADPVGGIVFGLAAAVFYSAYLLLIRRGNRDHRFAGPLLDASASSALTAAVIGTTMGSLVLLPSWPAWGWLFVVAMTSQVAGYGLVNIALPRLPAALTSILLMFQPVVTIVFAALILGERPSALQLGGVALILAGIVIATIRRPESSEPIPPEP
jgi:drug/metabolite transporter (DMT)-like permease